MIQPNTVITGDSLTVLRSMDDESVDMVITDPPYGIDYQDAPHTGARLETAGARTNAGTWRRCLHTGKRFKIFRAPSGKYARGCPYRLAAFCFTVFALFLNAFLTPNSFWR